MKISEPDKALGAFEAALRKSPGDAALASRIGKVRRGAPRFAGTTHWADRFSLSSLTLAAKMLAAIVSRSSLTSPKSALSVVL